MFNLILFLVSVVMGFISVVVYRAAHGRTSASASDASILLLIIAFLFCPFNVNGNIYAVFGSAESEGNIYSVFSPYQSGKNTYALFGSLYQKAENDAIVFFGLAGYQNAGNDTGTLMGFSGIQQAGRDASVLVGLTGYQKAGKYAAVLGFAGIQQAGNIAGALTAVYQKAGYSARAIMAGYQEVGIESRYFGLCSWLGKEPPPVQLSEKPAKK